MVSLLYFMLQCFFSMYNVLSERPESVHAQQRSGRPPIKTTQENIAWDILKEDRRSSRRLTAECTEIPKMTVQQILCEYSQKLKHCARFVPHALTAEQIEHCLNTIKSDPSFLDAIITGDES